MKNKIEIEYKSSDYLKNLQKILYTYIPNTLSPDTNHKREDIIRRECEKKVKLNPDDKFGYDIYDIQLEAASVINHIDISQLLGWDEIVVPQFIVEYTQLIKCVRNIMKECKRLNQFQELSGLIPVYDPKKIKSCLYDDLTQLKDTYNLNIDVKDLIKEI